MTDALVPILVFVLSLTLGRYLYPDHCAHGMRADDNKEARCKRSNRI